MLLTVSRRAKIADLGSAKFQKAGHLSSLSVMFNQSAAFPPEAMVYPRAGTGRGSHKWDVWQYGALVYEIVCLEARPSCATAGPALSLYCVY